MSLTNVRFAVKTTSVTPPSITGHHQSTTKRAHTQWSRLICSTIVTLYNKPFNTDFNSIAALISAFLC